LDFQDLLFLLFCVDRGRCSSAKKLL